MGKIKAIVKEKTILELAEDGKAGDIIDLKELVEVDTSYLEQIIDSGKDRVYQERLLEMKKRFDNEKKNEEEKYNLSLESLKKENLNNLKMKENEVELKFQDRIASLTEEINTLKATSASQKKNLELEKAQELMTIKNQEQLKYHQLEKEYDLLKAQLDNKINENKLNLELSYSVKMQELEKKYSEKLEEQKENHLKELRQKEDAINNLQRAKAALNVKQTGEDLESWCDNEVQSYMQNGLFNCKWIKDNKVVKEDGENKGSKADYLFYIYADDKHDENQLLASVCLDMKDENPDSTNKKTNADYYAQLDKNRNKKNCKYALLVSNLEMDKPNTSPIFKVREYENMYVVRPAYMMVFLNMLTSLTTRFATLTLARVKDDLLLKNKEDLIEEFNDIKNTYLDKPLNSLRTNLDNIESSSLTIRKAVQKIDDELEKAKKSYLNQIEEKIAKFELKLNKSIVKGLE